MEKNKANEPDAEMESNGNVESPAPPYNLKLDPDNATSPLDFEERLEEGRERFFPEGGPEEPPVRDFVKEYDLRVESQGRSSL